MKSIESRIAALEQRKPAPNLVYVATYRNDGSLVPLKRGQVYGRHVALMPAPMTDDEWAKEFCGPERRSWAELKAIQDRAQQALEGA